VECPRCGYVQSGIRLRCWKCSYSWEYRGTRRGEPFYVSCPNCRASVKVFAKREAKPPSVTRELPAEEVVALLKRAVELVEPHTDKLTKSDAEAYEVLKRFVSGEIDLDECLAELSGESPSQHGQKGD